MGGIQGQMPDFWVSPTNFTKKTDISYNFAHFT